MMLKTHKFARKPFYVDAIRVSETNMEEVAKWCEGTIEEIDGQPCILVKVHRPLNDRQTQAFVGDWVLFAGTGFKVYMSKAFDKQFEKVKTLTKAQADEAGIKVPHEPRAKPKTVPVPKPPRRQPPALTTNVGDALKEAEAKQAGDWNLDRVEEAVADNPEPNQGAVGHPAETKPAEPEQKPKTAADAEAEKLIKEVLGHE